MRLDNIDFDALLAGIGGTAVLLRPAAAAITFFVLRREPMAVRVVGAVFALVFPLLAVVGWFVYPKVRGGFGRIGTQLREAARQAQATAQQATAQQGAAGKPVQLDLARLLREAGMQSGTPAIRKALSVTGAPAPAPSRPAQPQVQAPNTHPQAHALLDPKRLLSSDLSVRFNTQVAEGAPRLNIPKVVE